MRNAGLCRSDPRRNDPSIFTNRPRIARTVEQIRKEIRSLLTERGNAPIEVRACLRSASESPSIRFMASDGEALTDEQLKFLLDQPGSAVEVVAVTTVRA